MIKINTDTPNQPMSIGDVAINENGDMYVATSNGDSVKNAYQKLYVDKGPMGDVGSTWDSVLPNEMRYSVDGEDITFSGKEIKHLREMLNRYILENHPEDLL